jgi:hypothetical protein
MTTRTARLWLGSIILSAVTVSLALKSGRDAGYYLMLPGALLAWPVWPEGIHSYGGPASALGFYIVFLLGNFVAWSFAFRLALGLVFRPKEDHEPVRQ